MFLCSFHHSALARDYLIANFFNFGIGSVPLAHWLGGWRGSERRCCLVHVIVRRHSRDRFALLHCCHFRSSSDLPYLFSLAPSVSAVDPSRYILTVVQGGTPFPSRDSLIGPTNVSLPYTQHVANMFMVSGLE